MMTDRPAKNQIRVERLRQKMAQGELARLAKVDLPSLRKWERGLEIPATEGLMRIAKVLGIEWTALERGERQAHKKKTPGEGYTTAQPLAGEVVARRSQPRSGRLRVLDLFCGSGGLSFGFEQTDRFVTVGGIDLLPDRIQTFASNHPCAVGIAGDIRKYTPAQLKEITGEVDVIVGGPPCQGFSSIRPYRNLIENDQRNSLPEHYILVIAAYRPKWFVFENVVGLLTHDNGEKLNAILDGFSALGYRVEWRVINAALFGVPQSRERIVIIGGPDNVRFEWPEPTHQLDFKGMGGNRSEVIRTIPALHSHLPPAISLIEAISDLPPVESGCEATRYLSSPKNQYQKKMRAGSDALTMHRATNHSSKMLNIIRHAGASIAALPPGLVTSGFSSCYSRLDADRPSTTLTVNFVHPASNRCIHPSQNRALTPREGARIQSFPDRFIFCGSSSQIVKQIGNAVPPLLGQAIAESILKSTKDWSGDALASAI